MILLDLPTPLPINTTDPVSSGHINQTTVATPINYTAIAGWDLFGEVEKNPTAPKPPPPPPLPETSLNLKLVGVFFSPRSDQALALIADSQGSQTTYQIGAALPGGARLERIERERVIVSRNGRQATLKLPRKNKTGQHTAPVTPAPPAPTINSQPDRRDTPQTINATHIAKHLRGDTTKRNNILHDIASARPYTQKGRFIGFQLSPGRNRQLFQQLGLNNGDVLIGIDNTRLSSPTQGFAMLNKLINAQRINVRILRNGIEIPLTFLLNSP